MAAVDPVHRVHDGRLGHALSGRDEGKLCQEWKLCVGGKKETRGTPQTASHQVGIPGPCFTPTEGGSVLILLFVPGGRKGYAKVDCVKRFGGEIHVSSVVGIM